MAHLEPAGAGIRLVDASSGKPFPCVAAGSLLLSSVPLRWRGITVEEHRRRPEEMQEHSVIGHGLAISTGNTPVRFGWKDARGWRQGVLNPRCFHMVTHGFLNTPRWLDTLEEMSLVLDGQFVADMVGDGLPADRIEFEPRRFSEDAVISAYAHAFHSELEAHGLNGLLYADALAVGFALHLLSNYAVAKPRMPRPRGKLNSFQLRRVVDFILSQLGEEVSLVILARHAGVSPFHFARLFRATLGVTPHQFVLRQRLQRSMSLIKRRELPLAQVAVECGFHDQAHLTKVFRRVIGTTPGAYAARAD
jgi:AraC family transcriptional regulator